MHLAVPFINSAELFLCCRDEGIVLKDLGSKWEPDDRNSGKWLKLKPDYIRASSDLDVLIIGEQFFV